MRKNRSFKKLKYGSSSALFTLLILVVIAMVYLTSELLTERFGLSFDMTQSGIYEVSDQTKEYLNNLDSDIVMTVLAEQNDYENLQGYAQINELLKKYTLLSHGKIAVRYVNVYKNPAFLQDYPTPNTLREGAVIIESDKRFKAYQIDDFYEFSTDEQTKETYISGNVAEQKLTSGIRYVTMDVLPQIVTITGHNESALAEFDTVIAQSNYQVQSVNLMTDDIPQGTNLVVLAAPQSDFTAAEIDKLDRYLENDESTVLYLYSPNYGTHPVLDRFSEDWGVHPVRRMVVDPPRSVGNLSYIAPLVIKSDVTKTLENTTNSILMMSLPGHFELLWESRGYKKLVPLLRSSGEAYAKDMDTAQQSLEPADGDTVGSYCLGVMSEQRKAGNGAEKVSRVFFYASDTLLADGFMQTPNLMNRSYASSLLSYLYKQEDTMVFASKTMESDQLAMTGDTAVVIFWSLVIALPCLILISGLLVWNKRRRL